MKRSAHMFALACMMLMAASTTVDLVDEVYEIPADEWRYIEVGLNQRPALVAARFDVRDGGGRVRVALMRREDLERLREGLPHGVMEATAAAGAGTLAHLVAVPGDYAVVVDNRGGPAAKVHLRVWLDFAAGQGPTVTRLSHDRRLVVIMISFAVFFGIVTWSARRLLRGMRR